MTIHTTFAQSYDLAAGIRLGEDIGVSVKMRVPPIHKNFTGEFIVQSNFESQEGLITLLGEQHYPLITRRLNLYSGLGVHAGWLDNDSDREADYKAPKGVSLIGGAELNFKKISISIDYKPAINLSGGKRTFDATSAITIRFIPFQRYDIFTSPKEIRQRKRKKKRRQKAQDRSARGKKGWQFWKKG